jgi:hypothetical protein
LFMEKEVLAINKWVKKGRIHTCIKIMIVRLIGKLENSVRLLWKQKGDGHFGYNKLNLSIWIHIHQGREIIAIVPLENGAFCTAFSENFSKF